jgi:hypothetical protein
MSPPANVRPTRRGRLPLKVIWFDVIGVPAGLLTFFLVNAARTNHIFDIGYYTFLGIVGLIAMFCLLTGGLMKQLKKDVLDHWILWAIFGLVEVALAVLALHYSWVYLHAAWNLRIYA